MPPLPLPTLLQAVRPGNLRLLAADGETVDVQPVAGSGVGGTSFVWRPGGVASANVFTDWPSLMAAVGALQGPKNVWIDASLAPANVPAGTWNVDQVTFGTFSPDINLAPGTVTFLQGAQLTFTTLELANNVTFLSSSTLPIVTMTQGSTLYIGFASLLASNAGAAPFLNAGAGGNTAIVVSNGGQIGDGVHAVLTSSGASLFVFAFNDTTASSSFWANPGVGSCQLQYDPTTTIGPTQTGVVQSTLSVSPYSPFQGSRNTQQGVNQTVPFRFNTADVLAHTFFSYVVPNNSCVAFFILVAVRNTGGSGNAAMVWQFILAVNNAGALATISAADGSTNLGVNPFGSMAGSAAGTTINLQLTAANATSADWQGLIFVVGN